MPRNKDLKRLVRSRMSKTGESYTTARVRIVDQPKATSATDYAAIAGKSDDTVKSKTGRDWGQWVRTLDRHAAHKLKHGEIADIVHGQYDVPGWWAQTVTVGYERIKGLRDVGQRSSGSYEASKSKTINVPIDVLFDAWANARKRRRWLTGAKTSVRTATRPRSLRLDWNDNTIVAVWFEKKGAAKSTVALAHTKLPDRATTDRVKAYWGERLDALAKLLAPAESKR